MIVMKMVIKKSCGFGKVSVHANIYFQCLLSNTMSESLRH